MTLFLANFDVGEDITPEIDLEGDLFALSSSLYLVRSDLSQSKIYHRIKWQLPPDTPLIVATLSEPPKFKGMAAGSLKWVRSDPEDWPRDRP